MSIHGETETICKIKDRIEFLNRKRSQRNPPRQYGKTMGSVLKAIGEALMDPGVNVEVVDDSSRSLSQKHGQIAMTNFIINKLEIDKLVLGDSCGRLWIKSENFGTRLRVEQT